MIPLWFGPAVRGLILLVSLFTATPSLAQQPPIPGFRPIGESAVLLSAKDELFRLDDGSLAYLSGIEQPPTPSPPALTAWAKQRRDMITALAGQGFVRLWRAPNARPDRWNRLPVQAVSADGRWIQGELLRLGLARLLVMEEDMPALPALLAAEEPARHAGIGLWKEPEYAVRRAAEAGSFLNSVQVAEGRIESVTVTKSALYLNLGPDKRHDLGVRIARRLIRKNGNDPTRWTGQRILVRGWVSKSIGPLIDLPHMGAITLLSPEGRIEPQPGTTP